MKHRFLKFLTIISVALAFDAGAAEVLDSPAGKVILTVTGNITNTNAKGKAEFDLAMIEAIGMRRLVTSTTWTKGPQIFEGILVRDLFAVVGAQGQTAHAVALNDYAIDIPASDFSTYPVLLALKMNGEYMKIRDKGPLWIVYPRDTYTELAYPNVDTKWIWQLKKLSIK